MKIFTIELKVILETLAQPLYHSVLRTSVFNKQIKSLKICKKIYGNKFDMMAEFCSILICCSQGKVKNLNQITWLRSDDDTTKRKNFIGIKKLIGKASNYQFTYDHKMLDLFRSGYLENFFQFKRRNK